MEPAECIFTGDSVTITCTCQLEACKLIYVLKNGQDVDNGENVIYTQDPCGAVHTFQADTTDDDGVKFSCMMIFANQSVVKSEPRITLQKNR